jgi:hypothetical protein
MEKQNTIPSIILKRANKLLEVSSTPIVEASLGILLFQCLLLFCQRLGGIYKFLRSCTLGFEFLGRIIRS